jgi:HTH-type transcriptional regulator / antitoxin HipB
MPVCGICKQAALCRMSSEFNFYSLNIPYKEHFHLTSLLISNIFPNGNFLLLFDIKHHKITVREYRLRLEMSMNLKSYKAEEVGRLVRDTRKKLGVTQRNLALTSGTGLRFIIELEQGKPTCQLEKVLTVLRTLGLKISIEAK